MIVDPFPLLGNIRRKALKSVLINRLESWRRQWIGAVIRVDVEAVELVRHKFEKLVSQGIEDFITWNEKSGRKSFSALLLGCMPSDFGGVAEKTLIDPLVEEALSDLFHVLSGEVSVQAPQNACSGARTRLICQCVIGELAFSVVLPIEPFADQLALPALTGNEGALQSAANALGEQRLSGHVSLGYAELTLGDVAQLAVGDVIRLDASLEDFAHLVIDNTSRKFQGQLGHYGGRLAIQIKDIVE